MTPSDPMGKCILNILATFAEFEVDLLRMRTREGMAIARAKGRLKGKAPKLSRTQRTVLLKLHGAREHSIAELAELFSISRATVYREIARSLTAIDRRLWDCGKSRWLAADRRARMIVTIDTRNRY